MDIAVGVVAAPFDPVLEEVEDPVGYPDGVTGGGDVRLVGHRRFLHSVERIRGGRYRRLAVCWVGRVTCGRRRTAGAVGGGAGEVPGAVGASKRDRSVGGEGEAPAAFVDQMVVFGTAG